jgi:hypothetical protein
MPLLSLNAFLMNKCELSEFLIIQRTDIQSDAVSDTTTIYFLIREFPIGMRYVVTWWLLMCSSERDVPKRRPREKRLLMDRTKLGRANAGDEELIDR